MVINTTTGKFGVKIEGSVATEKVETLIQEGLTSMIYRKAFPKTELEMAKSIGKTKIGKGGELQVQKDGANKFKRDEVPYSRELAYKLQTILSTYVQDFAHPDGKLVVEVSEYTAPEAKEPAQVTLNKAFNAAAGAMEGLRDLLGETVYQAKLTELRKQYNQPEAIKLSKELDEEMPY